MLNVGTISIPQFSHITPMSFVDGSHCLMTTLTSDWDLQVTINKEGWVSKLSFTHCSQIVATASGFRPLQWISDPQNNYRECVVPLALLPLLSNHIQFKDGWEWLMDGRAHSTRHPQTIVLRWITDSCCWLERVVFDGHYFTVTAVGFGGQCRYMTHRLKVTETHALILCNEGQPERDLTAEVGSSNLFDAGLNKLGRLLYSLFHRKD